jgi:hypothetical protein
MSDVDDVLRSRAGGQRRVGRSDDEVGGGGDLAQLAVDEYGDAVGEGTDLLGAVETRRRGGASAEDASTSAKKAARVGCRGRRRARREAARRGRRPGLVAS